MEMLLPQQRSRASLAHMYWAGAMHLAVTARQCSWLQRMPGTAASLTLAPAPTLSTVMYLSPQSLAVSEKGANGAPGCAQHRIFCRADSPCRLCAI